MSEGVIEPSAVYPPPGAGQKFYQTYNTRYVSSPSAPSAPTPPSPSFNYSNSRVFNLMQRAPGGSQPVNVPKHMPRFLGSRMVILLAWAGAMVFVSIDEWHTHHVLPRPARLWYTTLTYVILASISTFDVMVPIATALAIGFSLAVAYQYYNGTGQFGQTGATESGANKQTAGGINLAGH